MNTTKSLLAAVPFALAYATAHAQPPRCDCTTVLDSCTASVESRGSYLEIKTDEKQCSRVDYFVDGLPFVSVVVDGEHRQDVVARATSPKILVQSCQVCSENTQAASAPAANSSSTQAPAREPSSGGELEPLIAAVPDYPESARARGVEGYVDVEFTVDAFGTVHDARVVASQPRGVFDAAALAAVSRWRYPAVPDREPQKLTKRLDFKLPNALSSAARGPRNDCVREDAVYNYGESIDVGLIDACTEPLVVFGCAAGTGRYANRWLCSDSERQGTVLVPQADVRVGSRTLGDTATGQRTITYADSFSITRAPNAEYWWIACAADDEACRSDARLWVRSLEGQFSTVDPQARSRLPLAHSN